MLRQKSRAEIVSVRPTGLTLPAVVADAGERASRRFVEFFTANIRNRNTREAYGRAVGAFLGWCEERGRTLETIGPVMVAAYVEQLLKDGRAKPCAYSIIGGLFDMYPHQVYKTPRLSVSAGRTRMKNLRSLTAAITFMALLGFVIPTLRAQDVVKVAPKNCKVLLENDRVRVVRVVTKPGEKLEMHSHPANIVYAFTAGKSNVTSPDGKTEEREIKAGQAIWWEAVTHSTENTGTTEIRVLVIELKK